MIDQLLRLPYAHLWLPILAACAITTGVYWALGWSARRALARASASGVNEPKAEPAIEKDPFAQGSSGEMRSAFRRMGNPVEIKYTTPEHRDEPRTGYVLDRSVGGLGLMLDHELKPGTTLLVRPANASVIVPEVEIKVCSCRPSTSQPGTFDLGCQFVKSPPYSILLLFG